MSYSLAAVLNHASIATLDDTFVSGAFMGDAVGQSHLREV